MNELSPFLMRTLEAGGRPPSGDIAIIGMAGRFPGAPSVSALWRLVREGRDVFRHFSPDELEDAFDEETRRSPDYVPARPHLDDVDRFDAGFFGMMAREAAVTDPQQRVFLEIAWEAFEDAGYDPQGCEGAVGVFAGAALSTYLLNNVLSDRAKVEEFTSSYQVGCYPVFVGAIADTLATRVAHRLDLRGPAVTMLTACSTSLVCIAQACESLLCGRSDMALAGGVSITFPQKRGYLHQAGGMVSPDGVCRPLDAEAGGTVFGSGAGVVLLKRLEDALADDDRIHAVIRGFGLNNDGAGKVSYTGPSAEGQAAAIRAAHAHARVDPASIGYVECHGTATPLGDPIEFLGLSRAFGDVEGRERCALGSVKGNIGHLDAAAGVAGLIKTALMLREREIPPLAQFRRINPGIDIAAGPFYVETRLVPWPEGPEPRRAGVSAFGIGGTNVHVVLEEPPARGASPTAKEAGKEASKEAGAADGIVPVHVLPVSARSEAALRQACAALARHLEAEPGIALADIAFTLQEGRRAFRHRAAFLCRDGAEAARKLAAPPAIRNEAEEGRAPVVFMFPGQGSQYPGMGSGLYRSEPVFANWIDRGAAVLEPLLGLDIRTLICRDAADEEAGRALKDTRLTQPALFLTAYATARVWMDRGLVPEAMIGHSVGEFVAAALSGLLDFEDALALIAGRGRLMGGCAPGAMLSVRAGEDELRARLVPGVDIAALNAPKLSVVAGPLPAIEAFEAALAAAGLPSSRLQTSHAFHSAMMDPVVEALRQLAAGMRFGRPAIPFVSSVTGGWAGEEVATPGYWAGHCRATVRFADGLRTLAGTGRPVLLEAGPGRTLCVFAAQTLPRERLAAAIASLPDHHRAVKDGEALDEAQARLWAAGAAVDWHHPVPGRRVGLPTYPFQRERHFIDAPRPAARPAPAIAAPAAICAPAALTAPAAPDAGAAPPSAQSETPIMNAQPDFTPSDRAPRLEASLVALLGELSGEPAEGLTRDATFLELGFDSLFLGQFSQELQKRFGLRLSFRQLLGDIPTVADLAAHLDAELPAEAPAAAVPAAAPAPAPAPAGIAPVPASALVPAAAERPPSAPAPILPAAPVLPAGAAASLGSGIEGVLHGQIQTMQAVFSEQIQALTRLAGGAQPAASAPTASAPIASAPAAADPAPAPAPLAAASPALLPAPPVAPALSSGEAPSRFRMHRPGGGASPSQTAPETRAFIADLVARFGARNPASKALTQRHRARLADPRTAAGFRPAWKDAVFPIVARSSKGARIRDLDGNEYLDVVSGYGQTAFGHAPDFVVEAVTRQMAEGFAIGPQSPLAGEVAEAIGRVTGHERVTFCNTGSEAVMAAMRVARSVTGRERVVVFSNDYHGQFDEVLVKGSARGEAALPIAPGIPAGSVGNMAVLPYGAPASLDWIRRNAGGIAAVVIEPVQSRHPELRPVEFVRELRALTAREGIALVFDEVVSGFRVAPGGVQEAWGVLGDMATYGKVLGGGMPLGILAGSARFMDALDGGFWRYGDASEPEVSPTFFAGTFVRHPLTLAAARAVITHIGGEGRALYDRVAPRTAALVAEINGDLEQRGVPARAETFSSWFMINFGQNDPLGSLVYTQFRLMGLHIQEGFPCYLTTAHTEEDFAFIARVFREGVDAVQAAGILRPPGGLRPSGGRPMEARQIPAPMLAPALAPALASDLAVPASAPLTESQMEIWLAAQMGEEASAAFNESFSVTLDGPLDPAALRAALGDVAARRDALRLRFSPDGLSQSAEAGFVPEPAVVDLSGHADPQAALEARLAADAAMPFDLTASPPVRTMLLRLAADRHVLVVSAHHIVCDGWSGNLVAEDLARAYAARLEGRPLDLPPAPSFRAHAAEARAAGSSPAAEAYWLARFAGVPDPADLPFDRPRLEARSAAGATLTRHMGADLLARARKAGARQGCTLFSTLLGTLQILLARLSGQEDIAIAVPSAGQSLEGREGLVGHCVNLLPIRLRTAGATSLRDHFQAVQDAVSEAFEHRDYTYGTLVRRLAVPRLPGLLPLTQVQFNLERMPSDLGFPGLVARMTPNPKAFSNFDLFFNMIEGPDGLRIDVDYRTDILDAETVSRWIACFEVLLAGLADGAAETVGALPAVPAAEAAWLVETLNRTAVPAEDDATVIDMIARQALLRPDAVALVHGGDTLTYRALEEAGNRLARHIRARLPEPGRRVAVALDRSLDMAVALLAVMKAGHAYIPLDPTHPESRLALAMETAGVAGLLAQSEAVARLAPAGAFVVRPAAEREAILREDAAPLPRAARDGAASAYIIFTSGSTGVPKGVEVPHRALSNFLRSMAKEPGFGPADRIVALTTISFDIAALELYLPLVSGGTAIVADRAEVTDGFALVERIRASGASVLQATPTLWRMLLEAGFEPHAGLRMLCGGEALPGDLADRLLRGGGELWNMYGPTETTIWSSVERVEPGRPVTIGHPIDNTALHILSPDGQLQPVGATGELHIGGLGLAHGYVGQPELTAGSFRDIALPGRATERLYNTGDVGRRLADGSLRLLGRRDGQVKLRGFRIELGDIESVLRKAPGIRAAAVDVKARAGGDRQLVGYYVAAGGADPAPDALAAHVAAHLPGYMVPAAWMRLDALPETGNGKLDRKALPLPSSTPAASARPAKSPGSAMEARLAGIWKDVLGLPEIDVGQNIFALGADSLSVFRIAARMMDEGLGLDARDILRFPTVESLARQAASPGAAQGRGSAVDLKDFRHGARRGARSPA